MDEDGSSCDKCSADIRDALDRVTEELETLTQSEFAKQGMLQFDVHGNVIGRVYPPESNPAP